MPTTGRTTGYRALAELRFEIRRFLAFSERAARRSGLEAQQHQLLLAIKGLPAAERPTIGALAARLFLQHHSAVELADRLSKRGLVRRRRSERDGREVLLELTRAGEAILERLSAAHRSELRTNGPRLVKALVALTGKKRARPRARKGE